MVIVVLKIVNRAALQDEQYVRHLDVHNVAIRMPV